MQMITRNKQMNGIEIKFDVDLSGDQLTWLRENNFRWSKRNGVYWRWFSEEMWGKVHQYFNKQAPELKFNTTCDICGATVKKRGIGTHKRLKHGIVVKRVVTTINAKGEATERSIRPSAIAPIKSTKQEVRIEPAKVVVPDLEYVDKIQCFRCNGWFEENDIYWLKNENPYHFNVCFDCHCKDNPSNSLGRIEDLPKRLRT